MKNKAMAFIKQSWRGMISLLIFITAWQWASFSGVINPFYASRPSLIIFEGWKLISSGFLWPHLFISLGTLALGVGAALVSGTLLGLLFGVRRGAYRFFEPYVYILSTVPLVAFLPLIIIWFGIGIVSKVVIVFLMSFIPIIINMIDGVADVDVSHISMAKSFGASESRIVKSIIFFETLPFLFSGIRIAIGRGIIGLILGEAFGSGQGLGYLVTFYGLSFQAGKLMFILLILFLIAMLLKTSLDMLENLALKWKN